MKVMTGQGEMNTGMNFLLLEQWLVKSNRRDNITVAWGRSMIASIASQQEQIGATLERTIDFLTV